MDISVINETQKLKAVILGTPISSGEIKVADTYDPKSAEHILKGSYPLEDNLIVQMNNFKAVLEKHNVKVYRPEIIKNCNQIFARDIAFVVDDYFIPTNILPNRAKEIEGIAYLINKIAPKQRVNLPPEIHCEGGDILLYKDTIFIGTYRKPDYPDYITARTNNYTVDFLKELFPKKEIIPFDLKKSNTDPYQNTLHLDCCFQPFGKKKALMYPDGFLHEDDVAFLNEFFGGENIFQLSREEAYQLQTNLFSIDEKTVVSDPSFTRINDWLRLQGIQIEMVDYSEVSKQSGLFRCSTLPLLRVDD